MDTNIQTQIAKCDHVSLAGFRSTQILPVINWYTNWIIINILLSNVSINYQFMTNMSN